MNSKFFFLAFLAALFITTTYAQSELRVEIEAKAKSDNYNLVTMGEGGLIIFNETDETKKGAKGKDRIWQFSNYDTDFKESWTKEVPIKKGLKFEGFDSNDEYIYIFFKEDNKGKSDFQTIRVGLNGDVKNISGIVPNSDVGEVAALGDKVFFGGATKPTKSAMLGRACYTYALCCIPMFFGSLAPKQHPVLYSCDFGKTKAKPLTLNYKGTAVITDVSTNKNSGGFEVVVMNKADKEHIKLEVKEFDASGNVKNTAKLKPKGGRILLDGHVTNFDDTKIIIGTFAKAHKKQGFMQRLARATSFTTLSGYDSQGFYFSKLENNKQVDIEFYGFEKLQDFSIAGPNDKATSRAKKKLSKKEKRGKEITISYKLLVHDINFINDEYVMVAEAYYPEYHYYTTTDANGNTVTHKVFVGWRYTHAIVVGFDESGKMAWSHTFPIWDILTFNLKERVKVMDEGDGTLTLAYSYGGKIWTKIVSGGEIVDGYRSEDIDTGSPDDKVKANYEQDIDYWYDNYYLAYGYQKIKDKGAKFGKKKRTVFYLNKVAIDF